MFLSCEIGHFCYYNSGSPHWCTVKLYAVVDACQTMSPLQRNCNGMLQFFFMVFVKLLPKFISKFPKTKKGWEWYKNNPKLYFFVSLSSNSWQFQQQLVTKSETCLGFKLLGNH